MTFYDASVQSFSVDTKEHPVDGVEYSSMCVVSDGPPVAHAVLDGPAVSAGAVVPLCGMRRRFLPHGHPWSAPIPEHWERCPECLSAQPLDEAR